MEKVFFGDKGEVCPPVPMTNVSLSQESVMTVTCLSVSNVFLLWEKNAIGVFLFLKRCPPIV